MPKKRNGLDVDRFSSDFLQDKKGQITIFIIIGIVLLLAVMLIIFLSKELARVPSEVVPLENVAVDSLISTCLERTGEDALDLLGLQGGYIEVPEEISGNGYVHLRLSPAHVLPYWAYGESLNIQSLTVIKERIDRYIEDNLRNCVFGAGAFSQAYDLIERSGITADTKIVDAGVLFNVNWDIEIRDKGGEKVAEAVNHAAESPVKLKDLQETAVAIVTAEMRDLKMEDLVQDLLSLDHPNVPLVGLDFSCSAKKWKISEVEQTIKKMIRLNLGELKIKGTDFVNFPDSQPYYQNHYIWNVDNDLKQEQVATLFSFQENYPFSFNVAPRSGAYLQSTSLGTKNQLLNFFCMQNWKFAYTLDFPVKVEIKDETTGYNFNIAFTVHLKNNIPDRSSAYNGVPPTFFDSFNDEDYCQAAKIPMTVKTFELVENNQTGVYDRQPLDGVDISLSCLNYQCAMGKSEYNFLGMGDISAYRTNFPYCVGGIVRGEKLSYKDGWQRVLTENNAEVELELVPTYDFPAEKIKVVKHEYDGPGDIGAGEELNENEIALVKIGFGHNVAETQSRFHEANLIYFQQVDPNQVAQDSLNFLAKADFAYNLEIILLDGETFIGGYKGLWDVPWAELSSAQELVFHVLTKSGASEDQSVELLLGLQNFSAEIPAPEIR